MTYKHTLTLSRSSLLLRTYEKVWHADAEDADFCKLFWGTVLLPLAPLLYLFIGVLFVVVGPIVFVADRTEGKGERFKRQVEAVPAQVGGFFSRPVPRFVGKWLIRGLMAAMALALVALVGWGLYLLITADNLIYILTVVGAALSGAILIACLIAAVVWATRRGHFAFLRTGYYAVKTNTCPRIEVRS